MTNPSPGIAIIGGGIAGLATAIALRQKGIRSTLFEAAPEVRAVGAGLSLAPNATLALRRLGLEEAIRQKGHTLTAMSIRHADGSLIMATDGEQIARQYGAAHYAIHRAALHEALLSQVGDTPVFTGKRAVQVTRQERKLQVRFHDGSEHEAEALILADGIHSPIRRQLLPASGPRYSGYTCWRSVIQTDQADGAETTETWGPNGRFGIVPIGGGNIYWFATKNAPANDTRYKNFTVDDLLANFRNYHDPIPRIIRQTRNEDLLWNDIIDLKPISRLAHGNILFIGDAGHATTPNLGQGACQALEDAVVLADEIGQCDNLETAFRRFEKQRLARVHYVVNRSWTLGKVAQASNPLVAAMRNGLLRAMPASSAAGQFRYLYTVDF